MTNLPAPEGHPPPPPPPTAPEQSAAAAGAHGYEIAGLGARFGARVLDWLLVGCLTLFAFMAALVLLETGADRTDAGGNGVLLTLAGVVLMIAAVIFFVGYELWMIATRGYTLGKAAACVKVIREDDGGIPGWGKSAGRWLIPAGLGAVSGGALSILVWMSVLWGGRTRQGWHDRAAGTIVVRTNRG